MKKLAALAMLSYLLSGASAQIRDFQWLIGKWKLGDRNIHEVWNQPDDQLAGEAFEIRGGDTIVTEVISLNFYKTRIIKFRMLPAISPRRLRHYVFGQQRICG